VKRSPRDYAHVLEGEFMALLVDGPIGVRFREPGIPLYN
jgi:hypothetical protein